MKEDPTSFETMTHPSYPRSEWVKIGYKPQGAQGTILRQFGALLTARSVEILNAYQALHDYRVEWVRRECSLYLSLVIPDGGPKLECLIKRIRRAGRAIIRLLKRRDNKLYQDAFGKGVNYERRACLSIAKCLSREQEHSPVYQAIQHRVMPGYYDPYNKETMP